MVSDIHANLQAWKAVLLDIRSSRVDKIICLGDVVGYGPNPAEVLESAYREIDYFVLGNHDAVICGKLDADLFHDSAREIIEWTRGRLGEQAIEFLSGIPLTLDGGTFRCTHGDFETPAAFHYIIEPEDALASWETVAEPLLFVGHSHKPGIFLLGASGTPHVLEPQDFVIESGKRFLVNVGSVGQPRDGETRACYCLYDTAEDAVYWRRIPFDIDAYRSALETAGISSAPSYFLRYDPRAATPPVRELLSFSPAETPGQQAHDTVDVQSIETLKRRATLWKRLLLASILVLVLAAGLTALVVTRHTWRRKLLPGQNMVPVSASGGHVGENLLHPIPAPGTGLPINGWSVVLGNGYKQSLRPVPDAETHTLELSSQTPKDELRLSSPPVRVKPGMKLVFQALFKKLEGFDGNVAAVISLQHGRGDTRESIDQFIVKEPNLPRKDGWLEARKTFDVPADTAFLTFQVRGRFTGSVLLKDVSLVRK